MHNALKPLIIACLFVTSSVTSLTGLTASAATTSTTETTSTYTGSVLTAESGVNNGPSGLETYYNLDMNSVVSALRSSGYDGWYWVRSDGCKMFGNYVMIAADYGVYPYGSIVETSLGEGIVCDTGSFATGNSTQIDIAVDW